MSVENQIIISCITAAALVRWFKVESSQARMERELNSARVTLDIASEKIDEIDSENDALHAELIKQNRVIKAQRDKIRELFLKSCGREGNKKPEHAS